MNSGLYFLLLVIATQALGQDGIEVRRFGSHAIVFEVKPEAFEVNENYADVREGTIEISRSPKIRAGCAVKTPWIRTIGSEMDLEVYPKHSVGWAGTLGRMGQIEKDLFEIRVYTREGRDDDDDILHSRYYMQTGDIDLNWISVNNIEGTYYRGRQDNSFATMREAMESDLAVSFGTARVGEWSEFRVALCNVQDGTSISLESIFIIADQIPDS
ncbi:hypothetical protein N9D31_01350 [Oligoflexaceae bacterium]|nr:hypothetical protein [Oligoflexaceae bacterium]